MITEPRIVERAAIPYVAIRCEVTMADMGPTLPPLWGEVYGWLGSKGISPTGAPFWRYLVIDMENKLTIDVAVPVAAPAAGEGRIVADALPAGKYVTMVYTGPFDDSGLMDATAYLLNWGSQNNVTWDKWPSGESGEGWRARIENYWTDPQSEPDPNKYKTELAFKAAD